jgi:hypothetical protein
MLRSLAVVIVLLGLDGIVVATAQADVLRPPLSVPEFPSLTLERIELATLARSHGASADAGHAVLASEGGRRLKLVAPLAPLHAWESQRAPVLALYELGWSFARPRHEEVPTGEPPAALARALDDVRSLAARRDASPEADAVSAAIRAVSSFASDPSIGERVIDALLAATSRAHAPACDLDEAIALGDEALEARAVGAEIERRTRQDLAALLHRRASLARARGETEAALGPAVRAATLDHHPEYWATVGVIHEKRVAISRALAPRTISRSSDRARHAATSQRLALRLPGVRRALLVFAPRSPSARGARCVPSVSR